MIEIELLKSMNFDSEEYKYFWNREEYYFVEFEITEKEPIKLINCNNVYKKFHSIDTKDCYRSINDIYNKDEITFINNVYCKCINSSDKTISYMREMYTNIALVIWKVYAIIDGKYLKIMGSRLSKNEILNYFSESKYHGDIQIHDKVNESIILKKAERGYIIESYSDGIKEICHEKDYTGRRLIEVVPDIIHKEQLMYIIDKSITVNKIISYYDILKYSYINSYVKLTIIPIIHISSTKVFIYINKVFEKDIKEYTKNKSCGNIAECIINVENPKFPYIYSCDANMADYIKSGFIEMSSILKIPELSRCLSYKMMLSGVMESNSKSNNSIKYHYYLYPITENEVITNIKIIFDEQKPRLLEKDRLLEGLTPREREVVAKILDGYTNKYISALLNVSEGTIKKIIYNIYRKLRVSSRIEMVKLFLD